MIFSLLTGAADTPDPANNWLVYVLLAAAFIAFVVFVVILPSRKRKKQEKDAQDLINAVGPGNKVKTIGGICGIVVEVDNEESTFVLETGSEASGKCYIKFDRQAIYQTDAKVEEEKKPETAETPSTEPVPETKVEEPVAEPVVPVEEPAQGETETVKPKNKGGKKKSSNHNTDNN